MVSIEILRQLACFERLDFEQLDSIARSADLHGVNRDSFLFRAGERAEALFILVSGQLIVSLDDAQGQRLQLAVIQPGACMGEMGLSQSAPRSADVWAKSDSTLLKIGRAQFDKLVRERAPFAICLLADLSRKLQEANQLLENRVGLPVKERLWRTLSGMADSGTIDPAPKVTHLAAQIHATREMTSKALSQLIGEKKVKKESSEVWLILKSS